MSVNDDVRARIKALLAMANDPNIDGEVSAAMRIAQKLLDQHGLDAAEIMAESSAAEPTVDPVAAATMGQADATTSSTRRVAWEASLAWAVARAVGPVQWYWPNGTTTRPDGAWQTAKPCKLIRFYGPAEDAQLAAELYESWRLTIATLAVGKYGGFARGDGGRYAEGFAAALHALANEAAAARRTVVTASTTAIMRTGSASLAEVHTALAKRGSDWLRREQGVRFGGGIRLGGCRSGSADAYAAGSADGRRSGFSATRRAKLN